MEVTKLVEFGNEALYNGRTYTLSKMQTYTEQEQQFVNYLFSEKRDEVIGEQDMRVVQPEDIKFFFKDEIGKKPNTKPNTKPNKSQK